MIFNIVEFLIYFYLINATCVEIVGVTLVKNLDIQGH